MESSEILATIESLHRDAKDRGVFFQGIEDESLSGKHVTLNGKKLISFGSCSYLGLEFHPKLIAGTKAAVDRFGTQFSCSRGYLSAPLYEKIDEKFSQIFGGKTYLAPTTTLAHFAAFDALMTEKDALILDHQVHQSVQQAACLARTRGTHVEIVKHEEIERVVERAKKLSSRHRTVWFATDGIASMYGDMAPFGILDELLNGVGNSRLYIDDAHGMSWMGTHGRGCFLHFRPMSERMVVATSLAKAFGVGGGVLVFSSEEERDRVRMCGGTALFSGPIQPPMLGAIDASASVHLSPEIVELQRALREKVHYANTELQAAGLPLLVNNEVPIRFLRLGLPRAAAEVANRMANDGFYVNISMFPTVPMRRAGIRVAINSDHELDQIDGLVAGLARHIPEVMLEEGISRQQLDDLFARTVVADRSNVISFARAKSKSKGKTGVSSNQEGSSEQPQIPIVRRVQPMTRELEVERYSSIREIDEKLWNYLNRHTSTSSYESLCMVESLFSSQQEKKEHRWTFDYVIVKDSNNTPVAATHFTTSLQKDDMFMRQEVSMAIEKKREKEPYFLVSKVVMSSSTLSEGNPMYLDRNLNWKAGLQALLAVGQEVYERESADVLVLRDLPSDDHELDSALVDSGFAGVPGLDTHHLTLDWDDIHQLGARLSRRKRSYLHEQFGRKDKFEITRYSISDGNVDQLSPEDIEYLFQLYKNVAERKFKINIFHLPSDFVRMMLRSPVWEIVTLCLPEAEGGPTHKKPIAWYAAHAFETDYSVFLCGLDYDYVLRQGAYRQLLFQMIYQAKMRGFRLVNLGMDADQEKGRYGSKAVSSTIYLQAREHYQGSVMRDLVANIAVVSGCN